MPCLTHKEKVTIACIRDVADTAGRDAVSGAVLTDSLSQRRLSNIQPFLRSSALSVNI